MKIEAYRFGQIVIDGKVFDHDVILVGEEVSRWVRRESHHVLWEEVGGLLDFAPEVLIFGTGTVGLMQVPPEVVSKFRGQGIDVIVERTGRACEIFNKISKEKKVAAALHLTC